MRCWGIGTRSRRLSAEFEELGSYAKLNGMRVSFHPDHFTVLSTPRKDVLEKSVQDLERHSAMLNAMGLGMEAMCNIHVGGSYGDKDEGGEAICPELQRLAYPHPATNHTRK